MQSIKHRKTVFMKLDIWEDSLKFVDRFQFCIKSYKITGTLHDDLHAFSRGSDWVGNPHMEWNCGDSARILALCVCPLTSIVYTESLSVLWK